MTRKIVEILAPRAGLAPPREPDAGDALLTEIQTLIARGLNPDIALEASLRRWIDQGMDMRDRSAAAGTETDRGRESA
jgi:hypothetical protein